jgi:23S rRNA pseudouridine2605 synthase
LRAFAGRFKFIGQQIAFTVARRGFVEHHEDGGVVAELAVDAVFLEDAGVEVEGVLGGHGRGLLEVEVGVSEEEKVEVVEGEEGGDEGRALQKWLIASGLGSKREVRGWIEGGKVTVDGEVVTRFAHPISAEQVVEVEGRPVVPGGGRTVLLMNKPVKHVTGRVDPEGRPTWGGYIPEGLGHLFPVGRLDFNTEGVLLWTNDGQLARRILHPDYAMEKIYHVKIRDRLAEDDPGFDKMRAGMDLGEFVTRPAKVRFVAHRTRATWVEIVLTEGHFREVRRMCQRCGYQVVKLRRVAVGPIELGDLNPRCARLLSEEEVGRLAAAVGL